MATVTPADPGRDTYSVPPHQKLHYVIVQLSERSYVVAKYDGSESLVDYNYPGIPHPNGRGCTMLQWTPGFRVVTEPGFRDKARRELERLLRERLRGEGDPSPIVLPLFPSEEERLQKG